MLVSTNVFKRNQCHNNGTNGIAALCRQEQETALCTDLLSNGAVSVCQGVCVCVRMRACRQWDAPLTPALWRRVLSKAQ